MKLHKGKKVKMKTNKSIDGIACILAAAAIASHSALAEDFTVLAGSPTTLTASQAATIYDSVNVNDDLTIDGAQCAGLTNTVAVTIGAAAAKPVTVTVKNGAKWVLPDSKTIIFSGKGGTIVVSSTEAPSYIYGSKVNVLGIGDNIYTTAFGTMGFHSYVDVAANAEASGGVMDIARLLPNGTVSFRRVKNLNPDVAARILFHGGVHWVQNKGGTRFNVLNDAKIILESVEGNAIDMRALSPDYKLFEGAGTLETRGDGDFMMYHNAVAPYWTITLSHDDGGEILWNHKGKTVFSGSGRWLMGNDNILPYGAHNGPVVLYNSTNPTDPTTIDLNGKTVTVNGLLKDGNNATNAGRNSITNSSETVATLRLNVSSDTNLNRILTANFAPDAVSNIKLQKIGAGTLTIEPDDLPAVHGFETAAGCTLLSNVWQRTLTVCGGSACIDNESPNVPVAERPWRPTLSVIEAVAVEGGVLDVVRGRIASTNISIAAGAALRIRGGAGITNRVDFYTPSLSDRYFRFIFKESGKKKSFGLNSLFLRMQDGSRTFGRTSANAEITYQLNRNAASVSDLKEGEYMYSCPNGVEYVDESRSSGNCVYSPGGLSERYSWGGVIINEYKGLSLADPNTWVTLTIRLRADVAQPLSGYDLSQDWLVDKLCAWEVQASPDGVAWRTVDERRKSDIYTYKSASNDPNLDGYGLFNNDKPFQWLCLADDNAFICEGSVQVDEGGMLDLSCVPEENISIKSLTVDAALGGGSFVKFRPAENGTINLVGSEDMFPLRYTVPVALPDAVDVDRFSTWRVMVNGESSSTKTVEWSNGVLRVVDSHGLVISVR